MPEQTRLTVPDFILGLIFDCDGTLADSMAQHLESWKQALAKFSAPFDQEFLVSLNGMPSQDIVERYNLLHGTKLDARAVVAEKHRHFMTGLDRIRPIEPVVRLVRENVGKRPMAVVSGSVRAVVLGSLERLGIARCFQTVLTADDSYPPKPAPDLFVEAARRLGLPCDRCLVFEDGELGIRGARLAGMQAIDVSPWAKPEL